MTAPTVRGYFSGIAGWTTPPVAGDTIYMFEGISTYDYTLGWSQALDPAFFTTVRSFNYASKLATRTATGTSADTPSPSAIAYLGIAVYNSDGERYASEWEAHANAMSVGTININGGAAVGADDLLVVAKFCSALWYGSPTNCYTGALPTTPSGMTLQAGATGVNWGNYSDYTEEGAATLFTKQLSSTTNPGPIASTFSGGGAYGLNAANHIAILIKGSSGGGGPTFNPATSQQMAF